MSTRRFLLSAVVLALALVSASNSHGAEHQIVPGVEVIANPPSPKLALIGEDIVIVVSARTAGRPILKEEVKIVIGPHWTIGLYEFECRAEPDADWTEAEEGIDYKVVSYEAGTSSEGEGSSTTIIQALKPLYFRAKAWAYLYYLDSNEDAWGDGDSTEIYFAAVAVGLTALPVESDPILPAGNFCMNAKDPYAKAKWKATVLPKGWTADVKQLSGADVSVPSSSVKDGDVFEIGAPTKTVGDYQIELVHKGREECRVPGSGKVFLLVLRYKELASSGSVETADPNLTNKGNYFVKASAVQSGSGEGADLTVSQSVWVDCLPQTFYSGKVKAQLAVTSVLQDKSSGYGVKCFNLDYQAGSMNTTFIFDFGKVKFQPQWIGANPGNTETAAFQHHLSISGPNGATAELPSGLAQQIAPTLIAKSTTYQAGVQQLSAQKALIAEEKVDPTHPKSQYAVGDPSSTCSTICQISASAIVAQKSARTGAWVDVRLAIVNGAVFEFFFAGDGSGRFELTK